MRSSFVVLFVAYLVGAMEPLAQADIFVADDKTGRVVREEYADERTGYYYQSDAIDLKRAEKNISGLSALEYEGVAETGMANQYSFSFGKAFHDALSLETAADLDSATASKNQLLLLEYSSPAIADVIKHYRLMTQQRLAFEYSQIDRLEMSTANRVDRLRRFAERECLERNGDIGVVAAADKCRKIEGIFESLADLNGAFDLSDGRRRIHVLRDAIVLLGLSDKSVALEVVKLAGDVVLRARGYEDILPTTTFAGRIEFLRQEAVSDWKSSLESFKRTGKPVQAELEAVSFPGIPVMPAVFRDLSMLDPKQQLVMIFKLSAQLARAKAVVEYRRAAQVLLHCEDHPRLPEEFRRIIEQKRLRLEEVSGGAGAVEHAALVYKDLLGGIVIDADAVRADMLKRVNLVIPKQYGSSNWK